MFKIKTYGKKIMISQDKTLSIKTQHAKQLSTGSRLHFGFVSDQLQMFFLKRYKKTLKVSLDTLVKINS